MNDDLFERGLKIRKAVLGADYVEKDIAAADDFNMPLKRLMTEYCWGAVWGRDIEFLHDFRVACRRSRSILAQMKSVFPARNLGPLLDHFTWLSGLTRKRFMRKKSTSPTMGARSMRVRGR